LFSVNIPYLVKGRKKIFTAAAAAAVSMTRNDDRTVTAAKLSRTFFRLVFFTQIKITWANHFSKYATCFLYDFFFFFFFLFLFLYVKIKLMGDD
jgi:hypothetical protein